MPINTTFKAAIQRLAELASDDHAGYVSVRAAGQLAAILSPANPHHGDIIHELNGEPDRVLEIPASRQPSPPAESPCAVYCTDDDEEDDESEGANQDEEPL